MTQPDPSHAVGEEPSADATPVGAAEEVRGLDRLDPRAVTLWRIDYLLRGGGFAGLLLAAELLLGTPFPEGLLAFLAGAAAIVLAILVPPARHRAWGYRLRETDLYLRYGILIRTTSIVPHARIQHVDTRHGPIDRSLGLAAVVVYTAGTRGAIIAIPALEATTADGLRDRLVALSGAGDAV
ncbi:MAG TPA: PH domain-containing protein [Longimicrobiales bacterium]|nr:PH domain-containing protein [Longimicrobiales bacterium]